MVSGFCVSWMNFKYVLYVDALALGSTWPTFTYVGVVKEQSIHFSGYSCDIAVNPTTLGMMAQYMKAMDSKNNIHLSFRESIASLTLPADALVLICKLWYLSSCYIKKIVKMT